MERVDKDIDLLKLLNVRTAIAKIVSFLTGVSTNKNISSKSLFVQNVSTYFILHAITGYDSTERANTTEAELQK